LSLLLDLFERELSSDLFALTNIGKRISGNKELMIQFIGNISAVYTDCKFIYLPNKFKNDINAAQGLVAHEGGHIGYGSFELCFVKLIDTLAKKYKLSPLFIKNLVNVIEDIRVNAINSKKYPGFYRNLRILTNKMLPQSKSNIDKNEDILAYINLHMEDYKGFQKIPKLRTFNLSKTDWKGISKVKTFLLKSLSPSASIISADILCKILEKYFPPENSHPKGHQNRTHNKNMNTINQMELNSRNKRGRDKSDLDKTSEDLINKLKDIDLEPEDLEDFDDSKEKLNSKGKEHDNKKKKSKKGENDNKDHEEGGGDGNLDKEKENNGVKENTKSEKKLKDEERDNNVDSKKNSKEDNEISPDRFNEILENLSHEDFRNYNFDDFKKEVKQVIKEEKRKPSEEKQKKLKAISKLIEKANEAMKKRLITLEKLKYVPNLNRSQKERKVTETKIEDQHMSPDPMSYEQIKSKHHGIIKKMKLIFADLKNKAAIDTFQKKGRLNSKFIKAVTSDYQYENCFTKKILNKELRLIIIVDISGSMRGIKIRAAKIALVMLYEALEDLAKLRIVLFTGGYDALNILVKDFEDNLNPRNFNKFGCHSHYGQNLDGVSIKYEADKLEKQDIIIVISDGQPAADGGYSLLDAIPDIHDVRKRFRVFAFSIDSNGEYLNKLYGKDWILTSSRNELELGQKMLKFCQIIVREFYR